MSEIKLLVSGQVKNRLTLRLDMNPLTQKSKYLSMLLRHQPEKANLTMTAEGWVNVAQLLENVSWSMEVLEEIVATDNKGRYEFNEAKTHIRARQGHSLKVDLQYEEVTPPSLLYHGTAKKNFYNIWRSGLIKMKRHHVHLSVDIETAIKVGQRHGQPIVLTIEALVMHEKGYKFYRTNNGVWLVESVPPEFMYTDDIYLRGE